MTVAQLVEQLRQFDQTATLLIRDPNGLAWVFESRHLKAEDDFAIIDVQDINLVDG